MAMRRPAIRLNNADFPTFGRPTIAMFIATNVAQASCLCGKRASCPFFGPMTTQGRETTNDPPPLSYGEADEGMTKHPPCSPPNTPLLHLRHSTPRQRVAWA